MKKPLGTASPDLLLGLATLAIYLMLVAGATRFSMESRVIFGTLCLVVFVIWYFERYTFFEDRILMLRPRKLRSPKVLIPAGSVDRISFHEHFTLVTGPIAHIHFTINGKKDLIAFSFRRKHLFLLLNSQL